MNSLLVTGVLLNGTETNILCENGKITGIGSDNTVADTILKADGLVAHPPMLNSHTHAAMTLFRGNGDDLPLMQWLEQKIWPYEKNITFDEVYWGTRLAIVEMIRSGCTFFNDMYWNFHAVAKAVEDSGVRAMLSAVFIDLGNEEIARQQKNSNERLFRESRELSDRIQFAVGPHAIYTVSKPSLQWASEFTAEHKIPLHIHLSETQQEVEDCQRLHGCSPVEYLDSLNLVNERLVAAHTVWLSDKDIRLLGDNKAVCAHNPVSNMKLAVGGVYPYRRLLNAGAITAIATDGAGSNNNLDLFEDLKIAALLQKFTDNDPTSLNADEALDMATDNPASFFNLSGKELRVGREADFILLDPNRPELVPNHSLNSHLVYSANGYVVDSVVCDGNILMKHRVIDGEEEIRAKAVEAAESMFARVDG